MKTRIVIAAFTASFIAPIAFGQMYGGGYSQPQSQPQQSSTDGQQKTTTTTTKKTTYPVGVKGYLDSQIASSKDKKFHVALNGKDLALTPIKIHEEGKGSGKATVPVEMKGADGKTYEIDFTTSNGQVTGARVGKVNGKSPSSQ
jgi:hypothetical protein